MKVGRGFVSTQIFETVAQPFFEWRCLGPNLDPKSILFLVVGTVFSTLLFYLNFFNDDCKNHPGDLRYLAGAPIASVVRMGLFVATWWMQSVRDWVIVVYAITGFGVFCDVGFVCLTLATVFDDASTRCNMYWVLLILILASVATKGVVDIIEKRVSQHAASPPSSPSS